ncbi:MAG: TIGR04283 family arsenosugar biosynthesis glycosyltransferase [Rhodobacteraceae bacterium]|nr:TIGR04283 family arsenosugar biosynthesis glycosyltransferase [Paracoccaceae bacterium]
MPARISIIIPTLNGADTLAHCLEALIEGLGAGLIRELIVSDGGSVDATREIADAAGANVLSGAVSRGAQLRRGAAAAQGEWLLFLHADTVLGAGWAKVVAAHIDDLRNPAWFRLEFDARGFAPWFVAGWANSRAKLFGLPYGDQGLLVSRANYDAVGGYPDQPLMEDVALVRALGAQGELTGLRVVARTSAARYVHEGWVRRGGRNLWTLARYFAGAEPEALAAQYRR